MNWVKRDVVPVATRNFLAIVLYQLHKTKGWGKKRLLQFLRDTTPLMTHILDEYSWDEDKDGIWYCGYALKQIGVDLDELLNTGGKK